MEAAAAASAAPARHRGDRGRDARDLGGGRDRRRAATAWPPADYDAYAQRHGVPAGRWAAIDAAWQARMTSDWRIGAQMGEALEAARKRR